MTSAYSRERQSLPLSRRRLLGLLGVAGATALLAACGNGGASTATAPATSGVSGGSVPSPVPTTTATPVASTVTTITATKAAPPTGGAAGGASTRTTGTAVGSPAASPNASGEITIVESGATLPTGQVTFHWVDSGDAKAPFNKAFFAAYQRKHPTITIQYDPLPQAEINKVVPLGVQNGNAPDAFAMPQVVQGAQAVQQGWVAPLDDIVPNFARWKAAFPPGAFVSGITDFNGKTYTVPFTSNQRYSTLTLFNTAYLQQAGYDPAAKPLTWDEFRAAAKKITQQGAGKYYGVLLEANQTSRLAVFVNSLAQMAGAGQRWGRCLRHQSENRGVQLHHRSVPGCHRAAAGTEGRQQRLPRFDLPQRGAGARTIPERCRRPDPPGTLEYPRLAAGQFRFHVRGRQPAGP